MLPKDEDLPTWVHTALLLVVVSPSAGFFLFYGLSAVITRHLPQLMGPDFGTYLFPGPLSGQSAVVAGVGLIFISASFAAIGYLFSRFSNDRWYVKLTPWALLAIGLALVSI